MPVHDDHQYVHGYSQREAERLHDQAGAVCDLLHYDTTYPTGALVLEAGCGVGAQTITLVRNSPDASFISVDISEQSLREARCLISEAVADNVCFHQADIYALPFAEDTFDHIFICFVLEHLRDPAGALQSLKRTLKPGGTITVIEGDHGSCYWYPETLAAQQAWQCLIDVQAAMGGDSLIGRRLYPLLDDAGFGQITVSPRVVYADHSLPKVVDSFVGHTIIPMVAGVQEQAISAGMIDRATWDQGMADLHHIAAHPEGTFNYTFFKATAVKS